MSQSLAKDFNFRSLLKFAFPSIIIMMIFLCLYSIVDGFFIAQYVDSMALSAANIVYPAVSIPSCRRHHVRYRRQRRCRRKDRTGKTGGSQP